MQANAVNYMDLKNCYFHTQILLGKHQNFEKISFYQFFCNYSKTFYAKWKDFTFHPYHQNNILKCEKNLNFLNVFWRKIFLSDSEFFVFPHCGVVISIFFPHHFFAKISSNQRTKAKHYKKAFSKSLNSPISQFFAVLWPKDL